MPMTLFSADRPRCRGGRPQGCETQWRGPQVPGPSRGREMLWPPEATATARPGSRSGGVATSGATGGWDPCPSRCGPPRRPAGEQGSRGVGSLSPLVRPRDRGSGARGRLTISTTSSSCEGGGHEAVGGRRGWCCLVKTAGPPSRHGCQRPRTPEHCPSLPRTRQPQCARTDTQHLTLVQTAAVDPARECAPAQTIWGGEVFGRFEPQPRGVRVPGAGAVTRGPLETLENASA